MTFPSPDAWAVERAKEIVYEIRTTLDKYHQEIVARGLVAARAAGLEEGAKRIEAEEEMDGSMPDDIWFQCRTREGAAEIMRATVRATKRSLLEWFRAAALATEAPHE